MSNAPDITYQDIKDLSKSELKALGISKSKVTELKIIDIIQKSGGTTSVYGVIIGLFKMNKVMPITQSVNLILIKMAEKNNPQIQPIGIGFYSIIDTPMVKSKQSEQLEHPIESESDEFDCWAITECSKWYSDYQEFIAAIKDMVDEIDSDGFIAVRGVMNNYTHGDFSPYFGGEIDYLIEKAQENANAEVNMQVGYLANLTQEQKSDIGRQLSGVWSSWLIKNNIEVGVWRVDKSEEFLVHAHELNENL